MDIARVGDRVARGGPGTGRHMRMATASYGWALGAVRSASQRSWAPSSNVRLMSLDMESEAKYAGFLSG